MVLIVQLLLNPIALSMEIDGHWISKDYKQILPISLFSCQVPAHHGNSSGGQEKGMKSQFYL